MMDQDQYRESLKLACWSMIGMMMMFFALVLSSCKEAIGIANEQDEKVHIEQIISPEQPTGNTVTMTSPECGEQG